MYHFLQGTSTSRQRLVHSMCHRGFFGCVKVERGYVAAPERMVSQVRGGGGCTVSVRELYLRCQRELFTLVSPAGHTTERVQESGTAITSV